MFHNGCYANMTGSGQGGFSCRGLGLAGQRRGEAVFPTFPPVSVLYRFMTYRHFETISLWYLVSLVDLSRFENSPNVDLCNVITLRLTGDGLS